MNQIMKFLVDHFPDLLDISFTATIVILFVMSVRVLMKGTPKIFSYALWGTVLLRLLVPVSIESPVSFVPEEHEFTGMVDVNQALPDFEFETGDDRVINRWHRENTPPDEALVQVGTCLEPQAYLTIIWLCGMGAMLVWSLRSFLKLRLKLEVVIPIGKNIYIADDIESPFVIGFLRPRIYLPGGLGEKEQGYILLHEKHHIRRGDHIIKMLAWLALCVHWFNPFVWAAFILAGRDMEMSCDEAVIKKLGLEVRADYSASLLTLATGKRIIAGTPLAFGEGDPKGRIQNLASWRKPGFWVILICVLVCIALAVCLLTNPETREPSVDILFSDMDFGDITQIEMQNCHNGKYTVISDRQDISEICAIIKSVSGINGGSGKGYYEGSYALVLYEDLEEVFSIAFGDSDAFFHGEGWDGYPIRYEMEGLTAGGIIRLLSKYDTSGFEWDILSNASKWGVSMYAENPSPAGITLNFAISVQSLKDGFLDKNQLYYGQLYTLEKLVQGQWMALERYDFEPAASAAIEELTEIGAETFGSVSLDWTDVYGRLEPGNYRVTMRILCQPENQRPVTLPVYAEFSLSGEENDYGVYISVHEVTAEHLVLTFHRENDTDNRDYYRMNGFTLEKLENGQWEAMELNTDWTDSRERIDFDRMSQPQNGLFLIWEKFGPLEPGEYRIGQKIAVSKTSEETFTVRARFTIDGDEDGSTTLLGELPSWYNLEQAQMDGCVTFRYGSVESVNAHLFEYFAMDCYAGIPAYVRCASALEDELQVYDLNYDGNIYSIHFLENGAAVQKDYRYMLHYTGEENGGSYDAYEVYALTSNPNLTWESVRDTAFTFRQTGTAAYHVVYARAITYPDYTPIPESGMILLKTEGETLLTVSDADAVETIRVLFSEAEALSYVPKTYSLGPTLTFMAVDGSEKSVILDLESALFFYDGVFYQYGEPDRADLRILWNCLGIEEWPEEVK